MVNNHLVGGWPTHLKNMKVNGKDDIPYIMENKKCSKPPAKLCNNIFMRKPMFVLYTLS